MTCPHDSVSLPTTSDPQTVSLTTATGDGVIVLSIIGQATTARLGGAPTWNSAAQTFTQIGSTVKGTAECSVELWYLPNPGVATSSVSVPNTGGLNLRLIVSVFTGTGASVFSSTSTNTDAQSPSLTINSIPAGGAAVDVIGHGHKDAMTASDNLLLRCPRCRPARTHRSSP